MNIQEERFTLHEQPEWSPVRWAFNVWTWVLIFVALAVFEVLGDPTLAGMILCLKFAGRDLWAGYFFRYHDPLPQRGVMLGYFCFGIAFLKIAAAGTVVFIFVVVSAPWLGGAPGQMNRFLTGLVLQFSGLMLALAAIIAGSLHTSHSNVRPWLDRTLYK
ncbi:MAG: hypothetical protein K8R36_13365, partial [Planctomycetales bacterium]|nr:hypothetical protein [Planctomycetales bacterium]